jgi:cold shock CspA family protein
VAKLFPQGYGYIETADGREVYFHANSVLNDQGLKLGTRVSFVEEAGERGAQASTVRAVTGGGRKSSSVVEQAKKAASAV